MRYLLLSFLVFALACNTPKKDNKSNVEEKENVVKEDVKKPEIINNELILVLKDPQKVKDAKALVNNSGLTWNNLIFDQKDLKIALITVPKDKVDFWIQRLEESGSFKSVEKNETISLNNIKEEYENRLLSMRKTPCFGDCPVYELSIDKDGNVTYNGIQYVNEKGKHEFKLSEEQFNKLTKMLNEGDFDSFKDVYDNERITDLPSTFITYKGKQIKIRLWNDIPDALINVHEYIEGILLDKKFFN
ncbi:DUF6438 domain-containing protein [Tenacibaculum aiptasiae]|uniref:DUF6438 domain-containing protein n=1 Tax=Tenacibaculum aiptasiae TaxID=426481 RepID=UPI00232FBA7F|nr:DUF6438 domain-containing protein [Tenacibaculum aiptasiae]